MTSSIDLSEEELHQFVLWMLLTREFQLMQRHGTDVDPSGKE